MDALGRLIVNPPLFVTQDDVRAAIALTEARAEAAAAAAAAAPDKEEKGWSDFRVGFPDDDAGSDEEGYFENYRLSLIELLTF